MKYLVYGYNSPLIGHRLARTESKLWAYIVGYWYYLSYADVILTDVTRGHSWVLK